MHLNPPIRLSLPVVILPILFAAADADDHTYAEV